VRYSQALHYLRHRYTPSTLHEVVEESLATRPDLSDGRNAIEDWHEQQWMALKASVDGDDAGYGQ
jgi:hypothetical protein